VRGRHWQSPGTGNSGLRRLPPSISYIPQPLRSHECVHLRLVVRCVAGRDGTGTVHSLLSLSAPPHPPFALPVSRIISFALLSRGGRARRLIRGNSAVDWAPAAGPRDCRDHPCILAGQCPAIATCIAALFGTQPRNNRSLHLNARIAINLACTAGTMFANVGCAYVLWLFLGLFGAHVSAGAARSPAPVSPLRAATALLPVRRPAAAFLCGETRQWPRVAVYIGAVRCRLAH